MSALVNRIGVRKLSEIVAMMNIRIVKPQSAAMTKSGFQVCLPIAYIKSPSVPSNKRGNPIKLKPNPILSSRFSVVSCQ